MWDWIKRWRWAIGITAVLSLGLVYAFWPTATTVDTAKVTRGPMSVGVTDDGITRADEYYVITAPVTGYMSRIELEPGDPVRRGDLIAWMTGRPSTPLDPRTLQEFRGAMAAAQAAAVGAEASLVQARRDLARAEELAKRGFLPRAQLEAARTRVATSESAQAQNRAEAARIRALMGQPQGPSGVRVPVRAPASGAVLSVANESEGVVPEGSQLMTIGDPNAIEAVVDLLSREAVRVRPGNRVEITQWGGPQVLIGTVTRVEPFGRLKISALGIEEQRVNVIVGFAGAAARQAARLGHGYQLDATIVLWSADDVPRVPIAALFRGPNGGWQALVIEGGRARLRAIRLGHINDEFAEVLGGLGAGEEVVVNPANWLTDGTRIRER